jgi:hypothetical protein
MGRLIAQDINGTPENIHLPWNLITNPSGNTSLTMAANSETRTWNTTTSSGDLFVLQDGTSNSGTGYLFKILQGAGSTTKPFSVWPNNGNSKFTVTDGVVDLTGSTPYFSLTGTESSHHTFRLNESAGTLSIKDTTNSINPLAIINGGANPVVNTTSGGVLGWSSSSTTADVSADTYFSRASAGQVQVNTGTAAPGTLITGRNVTPINTVSFSSTPAFDASLSDLQVITLTGNVTSSTITNMLSGQHLTFLICQDGTGGRTFVWPTTVSNAPTISTAAGTATASTCLATTFHANSTSTAYALQSSFTNLKGNIATSQMNSGTSASSSTFFRGDGTWASPTIGIATTVTFSSTPTFALGGNGIVLQTITLTGNVTSSSVTGVVQGQTAMIQVCEDATAGRTFVWPTAIKGAFDPSIMTASKCGVQEFASFDGSNLYAISAPVINQ